MDRKIIIQNLRKQRRTYKEIGELLGISRQRVHQILTGYSPNKFVPITQIPKNWKPTGEYNSEGLDRECFTGREYLKEQVRRRDNHTCQICGKKWQKGMRRLDVHHLDEDLEGKNGYSYAACKNLDRQITLCHKCHMGLEHIRKNMKKGIKKSYPQSSLDINSWLTYN